MIAAALVIGVHLATMHLSDCDLSPVNPGVYVRTEAGFTAGALRNSYHHVSTYAGWTWQTPDQRFAITAGAITGYPAARVMPLIVPSVRLPLGDVDARISYLPKPLKGGTSAGIHLSLEHAF